MANSSAARESNIKETIESILIAFILAFIFRAFVVEAFVIPTGSMAPTLLGAHMRFTCPDCGYTFDVNYPTDSEDDSVLVPSVARVKGTGEDYVFSVTCPNCGYKLPRVDPNDPNSAVTAPQVRYGDRILVLKYLYLFQEPHRWDVVVFKAPPNPIKDDYSVNYIKRLTGKPGESVMILDGDVYIAPPGTSGRSPSDFVVQTKTRDAQDALWRIVYDNDFHPRGLSRQIASADGDTILDSPPWKQPWQPVGGGKGWNLAAGNGRAFYFDGADASGAIAFNPDVHPTKFPLTDWLAYDQVASLGYPDQFDNRDPMPPENNVSDLKLAFTYRRETGGGPLTASLSKIDRTFVARIDPNQVTLSSVSDGKTAELGSVNIALNGGEHRVEFTNVDYRVTLRIDGRDLIQTTPQQYAPDIPFLLSAFDHRQLMPKPTIRIDADHQTCTLTHIGLWRDNYYGNRPGRNSGASTFHATPADFPNNVTHLGADEYFVCGDNSPISGDARYWTDPINLPAEDLTVAAGRVPGRFLLGKAFFVYWPAGFRPFESSPALAPNFGDMRIIH